MSKKRYASVWDAIEDTPVEAENMKLRSSLTLFQAVAPHEPAYGEALARFFDGRPDERTLELL